MASSKTQRKLTAILSADVAGYSRLMGDEEEATVATLTAYRKGSLSGEGLLLWAAVFTPRGCQSPFGAGAAKIV